MGKKLIISESEVDEIRRMYGLVTEQSSSFSIPKEVAGFISKIESVFSYMELGKIVGKTYNGSENLNLFKNYVENTIGFDCWNNMSDAFKAQLWSYAFQADSGQKGMFFRWVAGLANAIDPSIDRLSIVNKPLENKNVQDAIKLIKKNCSNINDYYEQYLNVVDSQYKSGDYNDNYKNIWRYRPIAISRLMNGESWNKVKQDWKSSLNNVVTTIPSKVVDKSVTKSTDKVVSEPTTNVPSKKKEKITGKDLQEFLDNIRSKTVGLKVDFDSVNIDMDKRELTFSLDETKEPVKRLTFAVNLSDEKTCESCVNIGVKNNVPDDKRIKGKFENGTRMFELFALY